MKNTMTLPADLHAQTASAQKSPRGHILVVDDEEANRMLLRDPLEMRGYQVSEATNGQAALEAVTKVIPDTILLDVMMPGLDGYQVCRQLKGNPGVAHVPILMVTALADREERLTGIESGANDFLNKPVDIQDLLLRVGNAVQSKSLFDQLQAEKDKSDRLLFNALPGPIAQRMKTGETTLADYHPEATILVADLVGFTALAAHIAPQEIVSFLNEIFSSFDLLTEKHGLEKIKTLGDLYMVAGGLPFQREDHVEAVALLALDMRTALHQFNKQYDTSLQLRIGISTGPVIAGVIGRRKFTYDVWGETVNIACRLQTQARPGTIQVAEPAYQGLREDFYLGTNAAFEMNGHGEVQSFTLACRKPTPAAGLAVGGRQSHP